MALRLVSSKIKRIELGEGDWLDVREDISRREFNELIQSLPVTREGLSVDDIDLSTATAFAEGLFKVFVKGWSVQDADGNAVEPTVDNYQQLSRESASIIDNAVSEHFSSLTPSGEESQKSEEPSV